MYSCANVMRCEAFWPRPPATWPTAVAPLESRPGARHTGRRKARWPGRTLCWMGQRWLMRYAGRPDITPGPTPRAEIGTASCRVRLCPYVEVSRDAVSLQQEYNTLNKPT